MKKNISKAIFQKMMKDMLTNVERRKNTQLWKSLLGRVDFIKNSIADLKESKGAQQNRIEFLEIELAKARSEICQLHSDILQVKKENRQLKEQANELRASLQAAHSAVEKKQKMDGKQTILFNLPDNEKFSNETLCHLFAILHAKLKEAPKKSNSPINRDFDVIAGFIEANPEAEKIFKQKQGEVKELMNFAKREEYLRSPKAHKILKPFGMGVKECGNGHWRAFFYNDDRYLSSEAGTGSKGCRGGQNEATYFIHAMLF